MTDSNKGVKEILETLQQDELKSLVRTVTHGFIKNKPKSQQDAIDIIIKYSPDEKSILRRKAITKEVLFNYLHKKNVSINLPITKPELINKVLKLWNLELVDLTSAHADNNSDHDEKPSVEILAKKFTEWFYSMMNEDVSLGPEHFWIDAKIRLKLISEEITLTKEVDSNPEGIVELLFDTKTEHNLFFNPNLTKEGVQGRMDPHGRVIVLSCGTLHAANVCVGTYEQVFALARDPFSENNWKIKTTEVNLRSSKYDGQLPVLTDASLTKELLCLPST